MSKGKGIMKNLLSTVLLLSFIMSLACVKVDIKMPRSSGANKVHPSDLPEGGVYQGSDPDEGKDDEKKDEENIRSRGGSGASLQSEFLILAQTGGKPCATDRKPTRATAQQTGVWCWAASGEGVMSFHEMNLYQCQSVNQIKAGNLKDSITGADYCCEEKNIFNPPCQQTGFTHEVFDHFGIYYEYWPGSLPAADIRWVICESGPFTYSIRYSGGGGHSFVVKDYWYENGQLKLAIDKHESFTDDYGKPYPAGFQPKSFETYAEGWYEGIRYQVDFTYVMINSPRI
jgi:hypothetical protein